MASKIVKRKARSIPTFPTANSQPPWNPLVEERAVDTVENVRSVLAYLQCADVHIADASITGDDINSGRARIMECVDRALKSLGEQLGEERHG